MPHAAVDPRSRALRPDPLAAAYARRRIDHAQYLAGREFQRIYHLADKRRPEQSDALAPDQLKAWQSLTACYRELGKDGSAVACDALIRGMGAKEIAASRGNVGQADGKYYAKRFGECLDCLAETLGFERERASGTRPQDIGVR